jgi:hypothetical protein
MKKIIKKYNNKKKKKKEKKPCSSQSFKTRSDPISQPGTQMTRARNLDRFKKKKGKVETRVTRSKSQVDPIRLGRKPD